MFLGINMFWALLRAHFNPRLTARAKMRLTWAQNAFMPGNINPIVFILKLVRFRETTSANRIRLIPHVYQRD